MLWDLLSLTGELGLVMWLAAALFWGLAGTALASWLGRPLWLGLLLGAVLPILGPVVLLIVEAIARGRAGTLGRPALRPRASWGRRGAREAAVAVSVLAAIGLVVVTGLRDTELGVGGDVRLVLAIRDVGLTTVTVLTVLVLGGAAVLSGRGPSRWAAVAVAWCASWWVLWALGALLVGDTLRVLAESSGLADDLDAVVRVGPSWTVLLALACILLAWTAGVLLLAHRAVPVGIPVAGAGTPTPYPGTAFPGTAFSGTAATGLPEPRPAADPFTPTWRPGPLPAADPFARPADPISDGR